MPTLCKETKSQKVGHPEPSQTFKDAPPALKTAGMRHPIKRLRHPAATHRLGDAERDFQMVVRVHLLFMSYTIRLFRESL